MEDRVKGPAIGLMVVAVLSIIMAIFSLVMNVVSGGMGVAAGGDQAMMSIMSGGVGIVFNILAIVMAAVIFFGALKMKNLQGYGLAMAATIIAMLPCSACCIIGLPIGIWALVVLMDEDVKASFAA